MLNKSFLGNQPVQMNVYELKTHFEIVKTIKD